MAEGWAVSFNVETRVRSHIAGKVIDTEPSDDALSAMRRASAKTNSLGERLTSFREGPASTAGPPQTVRDSLR